MNREMHICTIASGHNFAIYAATLLVSILENSDKDDFFIFHIITADISEDDKNKIIELKNIKNCDIIFHYITNIEKYKKWVNDSNGCVLERWSYHIFFKLEIMNVLSDLDKVLFLDADTIVLRNLRDIFKIDIENYYIATVCGIELSVINYIGEEGYIIKNGHSTVEKFKENMHINNDPLIHKNVNHKDVSTWLNTGFMYMNLKSLRNILNEHEIEIFIKKCINNGVIFSDEHILNYFIDGNKILKLNDKYHMINAIWLRNEHSDFYIAHFTGGKLLEIDWTYLPKNKNQIYLKALKYFSKTLWFKEDPIYYINMLLEEKSNYYEKLFDIKLFAIIDMIVWFIPFKKKRDEIRKKMVDKIKNIKYLIN